MNRKEKMGTYVVILFNNHKEIVYEVSDNNISKDILEDILISLTKTIITNEDLKGSASGTILYSDQTYIIHVVKALNKVEARRKALNDLSKSIM